MKNSNYNHALHQLKIVQAKVPSHPEIQQTLIARDEVIKKYQEIFKPQHLVKLNEADFRSFLYVENNKHWTGLTRQINSLTADMEKLRRALSTLLDENRPIAERFDEAVGSVKGFGKALATAILLIVYPETYGVWNNTSEASLKILGLWPSFDRGMTMGQKYEKINNILNQLAKELQVDLWTLDAFHYSVTSELEKAELEEETLIEGNEQGFGLERHLHDFLRDNWELTELGRKWNIYSEPGDDTAGYEYPTDVGRIDILAKHRREPEWLVIELKRNQSTDQTVGQVLRYIGWVEHNMIEKGEKVKGMIISRTVDKALLYAVEAIGQNRVSVMQYEVQFQLKEVNLD